MKRRDFIKSTTLSFISVGAVSSMENANAEMVRGKNNAVTEDAKIVTKGGYVNNPYIITGRTNIKNPRWNAPTLNASDPKAATDNAKAINMMLQSGNKNVELDDISRYVNSTLIVKSSVSIVGPGRSVPALIWNGGDYPIIARSGYFDKNSDGLSDIRLIDLRITDLATNRSDFYSIDFTNGNSCGLERCWLDGRKGGGPDDKFGVALGRAIGSVNRKAKTFVTYVKDSRLSSSTLVINSTDYYISGSELWGNNRNHAVQLGGGGSISGGTQIVPGATSGIFLFNESGNDIDTLKIIGVYFDGSTDVNLFTGWGILSNNNIGLKSAEIIGCDFWHLNKGGIKLDKLYSSTIMSNFRDCDSDDTGEDDIVVSDIYGSYINNRHFRSLPPKSNQVRRNLGRPYSLVANENRVITSVGGQVSFPDEYIDGYLRGKNNFDIIGGSSRTNLEYDIYPVAEDFSGRVLNIKGRPIFSSGSRFTDLSHDGLELQGSEDLDNLVESRKYLINNISSFKNIPDFGGSCMLQVTYIKKSCSIQQLIELNTGRTALRVLDVNKWGEWKVIAS